MLETVRGGEKHDPDSECSETDFTHRILHDHARSANRTAAVADAELGGDDEDVRITLRLGQLVPELDGTSRLTQMLLVNRTVTVVPELAVTRFLDGVEDILHRPAVGRTEDLRILPPVGDGEPAFGIRGKLDLALLNPREQILIGEADSRKQDAELIALDVEVGGLLVAGEVAV